MFKRIKQLMLAASASFLLFSPMLVPVAVHAAAATDQTINQGLCGGAQLSTTPTDCTAVGTEGASRLDGIISAVINIFSLVVGIVAVIMIIIGGLKYITSGGDSGNITGAKNTILYAVIGLVVVALAQFIVKFVLGKATANNANGAIFLLHL